MNQETSKATVARGIGRPVDGDSDKTRKEILDAAERLFAEQGFAATSIREIADAASVNTAMVHYYFGKKLQLLQAVFERVLEPLAKSIASFRPGNPDSLSDFAGIVMAMASHHPNLPRLVTREVLLPGGQMREMFFRQYAPRLGGALPGIVRTQQMAGNVSADFNPSLVALLMMSVCMFPFIARDVASEVLNISFDQEGLDELNVAVTRLIERGFHPQGIQP
jgi:AcrR family transcriptional regulator